MKQIEPSMICGGISPMAVVHINGTYILGIYKGTISKYDILLKYRQKENDRWSRIRTPKHIHWAVDMLIKHYCEPMTTDRLLDALIQLWKSTNPICSENGQKKLLDEAVLIEEVNQEAEKYPELADKGEYSVKFLILIAKLLMVQEKTNNHEAFMFGNLLEQLRNHRNIFEIVSSATYRGR